MHPSFLELFDKYKSTQSPALICGGVTITYAQLHDRCLKLAKKLRSQGVGIDATLPESYDIFNPASVRHSPWVVIVADRSADAVIGVIAAMMAGGAYVLIEQNVPDAYIQSVIEDTAASVVLRGGGFGIDEEKCDFIYTFPKHNEIACAVFTSGSTGIPKGAVLEHRVINEILNWQADYMKPIGWTATAAYAPLGFIALLWELFFPLANGLTLHLLDEATRHDLFALESYIEDNRISYMFLPPNVAEQFTFTYKGGSLKYLRVAGGRLKACGKPRGYEIMYHLGMAENGGSVTFKPIREAMSGDIPIGGSWNKTKLRLDVKTGEMIVSGSTLFRGYLARREETERKLINGEYYSGDLAEMDENNELIHKGRNDFTVKMRDMKVNPAQIEYVLSECAGVSECCVTAQPSGGEVILIGWFAGDADEEALKKELSARLPEHMIPAAFVKMDKLPRNANGKTDRNALRYARPQHECGSTVSITDINETEMRIAKIFEHILGLPTHSTGAEESFLRLGGDSLKLIRLQAEIAKEFSANIPYAVLFENPTPRGIARVLPNPENVCSIPSAEPMEMYPLSAPMRQMWLLWRIGQDRGRYTVSIECRFTGELDEVRTTAAFSGLISRNAILRSRFIERDGGVFQAIGESATVTIGEHPRREFDLTHAPIFDITLTDNTLTFTTHHIIADATGLRALMEDFWTLYGGDQLRDNIQAHDITMWSLSKDASGSEIFWREIFTDKLPAYTLPIDFPRPARISSALKESISFNAAEAGQLQEYAALHGATLFQLFLAAYALLLSKLTGGKTVVIGVPFSGREHPDTARTIGMLVRTLPLRLDVSGMNLEDALLHTRQRFIAAWEHQEISLERLTEITDTTRTVSGNTFYDVMINYVPLPRPLPDVCGLRPEILRGEYPGALFDLVLDLREDAEGFSAVFTYARELFKPETIRKWASAYKKLLLTHELVINGEYAPQVVCEENTGAAFDENTPQAYALLNIWKDILHTETVSPDDNYFMAGGTSLAAIRIEAALFEKGWLLSASDILQNPKLSEMAVLIVSAEDIDWEGDE